MHARHLTNNLDEESVVATTNLEPILTESPLLGRLLLCHVMPRRVMRCHAMPCRVVPCGVFSSDGCLMAWRVRRHAAMGGGGWALHQSSLVTSNIEH